MLVQRPSPRSCHPLFLQVFEIVSNLVSRGVLSSSRTIALYLQETELGSNSIAVMSQGYQQVTRVIGWFNRNFSNSNNSHNTYNWHNNNYVSSNNNNSFNNIVNYITGLDDEGCQILQWLSPLEPQKRHQGVRTDRLNSVGNWVLETSEFRKWRDAENGCLGPVLFCSGNPGVGKTFVR